MKTKILISAAALATALLSTGIAQTQQQHYLLLAKGNAFTEGFEAAVQAAGGKVQLKMTQIGVAAARSDDPNFVAKASAIPELEAVVPDLVLETVAPEANPVVATDEPTLPSISDGDLSPLQWSLDAIHAREAWEVMALAGNPGARGAGVRVAVLDGGIDLKHPDLYPNLNLALSRCFVDDESLQYKGGGPIPFAHGSAVASIIAAADDGAGIIGVAPEAEIVHVKISRESTGSAPSAVAMAGLCYAADIGADVANMSQAGYCLKSGWIISPSDPSRNRFIGADFIAWQLKAWNRAVNYAHSKGVTIIACAGNEAVDRDQATDLLVVPGDLPHVIEVSATGPFGWANDPNTDLDLPAPYTDYGQSAIDLAAPGGFSPYPHPINAYLPFDARLSKVPLWAFDLVLIADHKKGWAWVSGTSFAAPQVAGVAALVIGAHGGCMDPDQVRTILEQSADDLGKPGNDDFYGAGRVNALNAVLQ